MYWLGNDSDTTTQQNQKTNNNAYAAVKENPPLQPRLRRKSKDHIRGTQNHKTPVGVDKTVWQKENTQIEQKTATPKNYPHHSTHPLSLRREKKQ